MTAMMRTVLVAWSALAIPGGSPPLADEALRQQLLQEAPKAWATLAQQASRLEGTFRSHESHGSGTRPAQTQHISFAIDGTNLKRRIVSGGDESEHITIVNHGYLFEVARDRGGDSAYSLVFLESKGDPAVISAEDIEYISIELFDDVHAPWTMAARSLADWFSDPGFSIERVEAVEGDGGGALVRVHFVYEPEDEPKETHGKSGTMTLDPDNRWCLAAYEYKGIGGAVFEGTLDYEGEQAGIPFLRKKQHRMIGFGRDGPKTRVLEFERLSNEVPPAGDFRLSAYGFPEPRFEPRVTPTHLVFYILAALFLAFFIFLRVRRRRRAPALEGA